MHSSRSLAVPLHAWNYVLLFICRFRKDIIPYHSHTVVTGNRHIFFFLSKRIHIQTIVSGKSNRKSATNWHWKNERETHRGSTDRVYRYLYVCMRVPLMNVHWIVWLNWLRLKKKIQFSLKTRTLTVANHDKCSTCC